MWTQLFIYLHLLNASYFFCSGITNIDLFFKHFSFLRFRKASPENRTSRAPLWSKVLRRVGAATIFLLILFLARGSAILITRLITNVVSNNFPPLLILLYYFFLEWVPLVIATIILLFGGPFYFTCEIPLSSRSINRRSNQIEERSRSPSGITEEKQRLLKNDKQRADIYSSGDSDEIPPNYAFPGETVVPYWVPQNYGTSTPNSSDQTASGIPTPISASARSYVESTNLSTWNKSNDE
jgi:hypothetical protein